MPKEYFPTTDQFPTITVLVSAPDTLAGSLWRGTIPLAGLAFDGRAAQAAIIGAVVAARFGGESLPADVSLRLLANVHGADYGANFDARQTPLGSIGFEIAFGSSFAGMTDVPLTFTVTGHATDGPALEEVVLPTIATNDTELTLKDGQGGTLPGGYAFEAVSSGGGGESGGDAATLQGHPASHFALASHSHPAAAITDFAEAVQDAVAAALVAGSGQAITYDDASNTITFVNAAPLTTESVQDIVGAMVEAGTNVSTTYDDASGKLTITASGGGGEGGGFSQEQIEDMVAALLVAGTNVTLNYNDATGELEIVAAGGGGDADTLGGQGGSYYRNADHHTDGTTNKVFTAAEKTKLAGIATGATANAKASDAEVVAGTENTKFVTPAQAKLAAQTHGSGEGGGGGTGGLTVNRIKKLSFDEAPALMHFGIAIGDGVEPVVLRGDMEASEIQAAFAASSDLAAYTVMVKGSANSAGPLGPGVQEVQSYTFNNFMAMDGLAVGFSTESYYDIAAATDFGAGTVNLSAIQSGLNALPGFSSNPVSVSGTLSYDNSDMGEYEGTLILTFQNPAPVASLVKLISPYMMFEMGNLTRTTAGEVPVQTVNTGPDGSPLFTGNFFVMLTGPQPYPAWGAFENGEVQSVTFAGGASDTYILNGGASMGVAAINATGIQANQQALGGAYAGVLVAGENTSGGTPIVGGTMSASSSFSDRVAALGRDGTVTTHWHSDTGVNMPQWLQVDFGSPKNVSEIAIQARDVGAPIAPKNFEVYGSSTGAFSGEETLLLSVADSGITALSQEEQWELTTLGSFRYVRLKVITNSDSLNFCAVGEIQYFEPAEAEGTFYSYFPPAAGNVADPSITGTGGSVNTIHQGGAESEIAIAEDASLDELLWAAIP